MRLCVRHFETKARMPVTIYLASASCVTLMSRKYFGGCGFSVFCITHFRVRYEEP